VPGLDSGIASSCGWRSGPGSWETETETGDASRLGSLAPELATEAEEFKVCGTVKESGEAGDGGGVMGLGGNFCFFGLGPFKVCLGFVNFGLSMMMGLGVDALSAAGLSSEFRV